jgi:hypothetical protein
MKPLVENERETLRQIVRGDKPLDDLQSLGMKIELSNEGRLLRASHAISATADVHDLAKGFLTYRDDPDKLKEWAFFVEAADLDLDVSNHPAGETLQNALWKASFGESLDPSVIRIIEQLA